MEELFNKPILDQMYWFRKEDFEQYIYDKTKRFRKLKGRFATMQRLYYNSLMG